MTSHPWLMKIFWLRQSWTRYILLCHGACNRTELHICKLYLIECNVQFETCLMFMELSMLLYITTFLWTLWLSSSVWMLSCSLPIRNRAITKVFCAWGKLLNCLLSPPPSKEIKCLHFCINFVHFLPLHVLCLGQVPHFPYPYYCYDQDWWFLPQHSHITINSHSFINCSAKKCNQITE
jgi:hypothetical protein